MLDEAPLVSIIIPLYNSENYIEETLNSVVNQSYANWECIIVDDGSTDNSFDVADGVARVNQGIVVRKRDNSHKGVSVCRNIGIEYAKGDFVLFLDADDLLSIDCLQNRVDYMLTNRELDFAVFQMETFGSNCRKTTKFKNDYLDSFLRFDFPWTVTAPLWRREVLIESGCFSELLNVCEDPEFHIRVLLKNPIYHVNTEMEPDSFYRQRELSTPVKNDVYLRKLKSFVTYISILSPLLSNQQKRLLKNCSYKLTMNIVLPADLNDILLLKDLVKVDYESRVINWIEFKILNLLVFLLSFSKLSIFNKFATYAVAIVFNHLQFFRDYRGK